jgi:hypothetical protein
MTRKKYKLSGRMDGEAEKLQRQGPQFLRNEAYIEVLYNDEE